MNRILFSLFFVALTIVPSYVSAELGKVIQIVGDVDITSLSTGRRFIPVVGDSIVQDHKIRTGKNSFIEILLNDGTKIYIREVTVLSITKLKLEEADAPGRIRVLTGKVRITIKNIFESRILILKTPTAIIGVSGTDFGVITSRDETKVVVFDGEIELASSNRNVIKSLKLRSKEEVTIKKNRAPSKPVTVPPDLIKTWFNNYEVVDRKKIVFKGKKESGIIDLILRKKKL
ncbi:MAG: FecR family protein [Spirochaetota bacterium]|nr:FecR family protein [Spirochaetota bacterium]